VSAAQRRPRVLVTAGPTREPIDRVRYLTNRSSGRMGYAVAAAALAAGCDVDLVTGPVELEPPKAPKGARLTVHRVETARQMRAAALPAFRGCDLAFHVAAVSDFRPARFVRGKLKKRDLAARGGALVLELVPNPDILWECGQRKHQRQLLVGFALEAADGVRNALLKLREKNLDFVVLNGPSALNATRADVTVLARDGERISIRAEKSRIGGQLVALALERWRRQLHKTKATIR